MRKSIAWLLVVVLIMGLVGMVSGASSWIAGNEVIDRASGPDGWTNFYLADGNNEFSEDTIMTGWSAYVKRLSSFEFMVFAPTSDEGWKEIYRSGVVNPDVLGVHTVSGLTGVKIPAGSYVGLYYPTNGAIPYTITGTHYQGGVLTRAVLFTNNNNGYDFVDFYNSGDRMYSIQAHGFTMPLATWLPPISLDHFELNENATLPIKFKLDGDYSDVTLNVGGQEIPLKQEWDEENGDFYLGLFKPTATGNFNAEVLVNGVCVKSRTFNVFEVAPNGNGRGRK